MLTCAPPCFSVVGVASARPVPTAAASGSLLHRFPAAFDGPRHLSRGRQAAVHPEGAGGAPVGGGTRVHGWPPPPPQPVTMTATVAAPAAAADQPPVASAPGYVELPTATQPPLLDTSAVPPSSVLAPGGLVAAQHTASGARVVFFAAPGPLVSVHAVVATEPVGDGGHPHCLEHLIFLGSDAPGAGAAAQPRGYLDTLAARCLSSGTNAWTATDHTAYTVTTAGADGAAAVLPVLLSHVLVPRLDDDAYAGEVMHVRGDGSRAGVVYQEMLGRERTEGDQCDLELRRALFRGSAIACEAGGRTPVIAGELDNEAVVAFHRAYYHPANLTVVVGAQDISEDARARLLNAIGPVFDAAAAVPADAPAVPATAVASATPGAGGDTAQRSALTLGARIHPWMEVPPPFTPPTGDVVRKAVRFAASDDTIGSLAVGWRPAVGRADVETAAALEVLLLYLTDTAASPLSQRFVEVDDPLANDVDFDISVSAGETSVTLYFSGVPCGGGENAAENGPEGGTRTAADSKKDASMDDAASEDIGDEDTDTDIEDDEDDDNEDDDDEEEEDVDEDESGEDDDEHHVPQEDVLTNGQLADEAAAFLAGLAVEKAGLPGGVAEVRASLSRLRSQLLRSIEDDPHGYVSEALIPDLVAAHRADAPALGTRLRGMLPALDALATRDEAFWLDLLRTTFVDAPRAEMLMVPDAGLAESLAKSDAADLRARVAEAGPKRLTAYADAVAAREAALEKEVTRLAATPLPPMPSTERVPRLSSAATLLCPPQTASLGLPAGASADSGGPLFWAQTVTMESAFASATVLISTAGLTFRQRLYLGLLSELALSSHILASPETGADAGKPPAIATPYTALVSAVSASTTNCSVTIGGGGGSGAVAGDTLVVHYVAEAARFAEATDAVLHALFAASVTADRLVAVAKNELSDTTEALRDGGSVAYAVARAVAEVRLLSSQAGVRGGDRGVPTVATTCTDADREALPSAVTVGPLLQATFLAAAVRAVGGDDEDDVDDFIDPSDEESDGDDDDDDEDGDDDDMRSASNGKAANGGAPDAATAGRVVAEANEVLDVVRATPPPGVLVQVAGAKPDQMLADFSSAWRVHAGAFHASPRGTAAAAAAAAFRPAGGSPDSSVALDWSAEVGAYVASVGGPPLGRAAARVLATSPRGGVVVGVAGVDSGYVQAWLPADVPPATPDASALTVLVHLLSRVEGPLYKAVRGGGLAYDASVSFDAAHGRLVAGLSEAKSPAAAWSALVAALAEVRSRLVSATADVEREVDTARAAAVYAAVESRSAPSLVASAALRRSGMRLPACNASAQEARLARVSRADCVRVLDAYLHPLLPRGKAEGGVASDAAPPPSSSTIVLVAVVAPSEVASTAKEVAAAAVPVPWTTLNSPSGGAAAVLPSVVGALGIGEGRRCRPATHALTAESTAASARPPQRCETATDAASLPQTASPTRASSRRPRLAALAVQPAAGGHPAKGRPAISSGC